LSHYEVTIIPDDTASSGRDPSERIEEFGMRAEDSTRRIAAAIAGALEGFVEALDEYDVANEGRRAIEQAGDVSRAAAVEGRTLAQSDEMQQLGRGVRRVGTATSDVTHRMGERVGDTTHRVGDGVHHATDAVKSKLHDVNANVHERAESVKYAAYRAKEDVKMKAGAVAETGRRARVAPGIVANELSEWFAAWKRGLVMSIVGVLVMAVFATIALVVLTIALVVGLNELVGDPAGTFLVALLYLVIGAIGFAVGRSMKNRAAQEREERMMNAREEVRHVARPVRDAFGRGRTQI
jgi:hypothetical protein